MKNETKKVTKTASFRQQAEALFKVRNAEKPVSLTESETIKLLHELDVYQIELEMQNEELQTAVENAEINAEKYANLYDFAPSGYFTLNSDSEICELNFNGAKMLGKERSKLIHSNFKLFVALDTRKLFADFLDKVSETKTKQTCEVRFVIKDEPSIFVYIEGVLADNENNYLLTVVDVSELKYAEMELINAKESAEESEIFLDNIINNIGDPIFLKDAESHVLLVNDAFCDLFNLSRADILGKTMAEGVPPYEKDHFLRIDEQVIANGLEIVVDENFTFGDHETRILSTKKTRFIDESGTKFLIGIIRDITDRKKSELALKESEAKFRAMVESSPIGIFFVNTQGYVTYGNKADMLMTGLTLEETLGLNWVNAIHPEDRVRCKEEWITAMDAGIQFKGQGRYLHKDGKIVFWDVMTAPVIVDGELSGHIGMVLDITEKLKSESEIENYKNHLEELVEIRTIELEKEKIEAQSAVLMKSAFLASMSHELRTPLNSIIGFTGILLKEFAGSLNDEQKRQLGMIKKSGEHLLGLINDVLDISRIEAGRLRVIKYPFNYLISLKKIVDFLEPQAIEKGLIMDTEISEQEITLNSDERRVEQILLNLLSNAIKFSKKGMIRVKVDVKEDILITQIIDQGIGIQKDNIAKLFRPFIQFETGLNRSHEGSGLGLSICENLIEKLGGTIHVVSELGKGSNFTFKLPLK
jgi:PAS domain S-box-containing protein